MLVVAQKASFHLAIANSSGSACSGDASLARMAASMCSLLQATPLLDKYIFSTFKSAFGGRVRFIVSGGAPLSTHVEEYLAVTLCTPVFQASHPAKLFLHP